MTAVEGEQKYFDEKTPEELRHDFRKKWVSHLVGSFPRPNENQQVNESKRIVEAYEVKLNPQDSQELHQYGQLLPLQAIAAGFAIVGVVPISDNSYTIEGNSLTSITYLLESPMA